MTFHLQIFLEALHTATIVPFGHEPTIYAMKMFGGYDMAVPMLLAIIGATLGQLFNWYVGRSLIYFEYKGKWRLNPHMYEKTRAVAEKYGIFLLLLSWLPLCNLFVVMAGFLKLPLKTVMPLVILGLAMHYGLVVL